MYETTVSVVKENGHLLDYVKGQLAPCIEQIDGIVSEMDERNRNYFSLACADTYRFQVQRKLCDAVSQSLTLGYKNIFVRKLLKIDKNNFYHNVLVNTICIFDIEYDKQIVSKIVDIDRTICLDGYYNFRLGPIKKKWQEITKLVSDNFYVMSDSTLIVEFLQYLLESTPSKCRQLSVSVNGDEFVLYGNDDKVIEPISSMAKISTCEEEVMLNILCLKPRAVRIYHSRSLNKDFCDMLGALFETEYIEVE
ncbi:MAG: hypothetical protein J1G02_04055 [Clostridiales bacterium]|nr:hypothetical protein [Clostridiales bacterium]